MSSYFILVSLGIEDHQGALVLIVEEDHVGVSNGQDAPIETLRERNLLVRFDAAVVEFRLKR